MKDAMLFYGVTLGQRYNQPQKQFFFDQVSEIYKKLGYSVSLQSQATRYNSVNNIIIGNVEKAKTIVAASYDTPAKIKFCSVPYFPFNAKKNVQIEALYSVAQWTLITITLFLMFLVLRNFFNYALLMKIISVALTLCVGLFVYWLLKSLPSPINFNRNSAALAIINKLAEGLKKTETAFVLLDQSVNSYQGLQLLSNSVKRKQRVILLEALAAGEKLVVAHKEKTEVAEYLADRELKFIDKVYNDEQSVNNQLAFFDQLVILVSGSIERAQFVVKKTRNKQDIDVDISRMDKLAEVIRRDITKYNKG